MPATPTDAHPPREIAEAVETLGVAKAKLPGLPLFTLAVLAGAFISMSALFFLVATTNTGLGFGPTRVLGGLAFSLGLILVVVAGAELFTGNNLIAMAWASRLVGTGAVLRNWAIVYVGNVVGCLGTVALVGLANLAKLDQGGVGLTAIKVAASKSALPLGEAFARGVLCNALVCLAVWLTIGGRSVTDKILAVIFPITAFVAIGLEHSIANWFFLPYGMLLAGPEAISLASAAQNLTIVTLGNIVGGTLLVASVYWLAYLRGPRRSGN
ncbi:MAG: formate/nitrite transporter family protein [Kofleriaceae bacterium]|nr:formate/nitrite transporter family protein [Kofleriaceae bacterium]